MVKEVGEFSPHTLHLSSMDVNTDLPTPNASSWVGFFRSNAALGSIRIHRESCNTVQLFWWGWSYWSAWIERTQINWQLSFISMTVAGTCYFIAQKKTSILLERMKFTRETTPKKKKKEMKEDVLHIGDSLWDKRKWKHIPNHLDPQILNI